MFLVMSNIAASFVNKIGPRDPDHVLANPATVAFAYICTVGELQRIPACTSMCSKANPAQCCNCIQIDIHAIYYSCSQQKCSPHT